MEASPRRDAVGDLAAEQGQSLVTFAFLLCGSAEEADDLVQTVLLRMLEARSLGSTGLGAYARRAIVNEFIDRRRRTARLGRVLTLLRGDAGPKPRAEEAVVEREQLLAAFAVLSRRERAVIVLRYFEDWDDAAIGQALGCERATVRSIAARCMPKLRQALAHESLKGVGHDAAG